MHVIYFDLNHPPSSFFKLFPGPINHTLPNFKYAFKILLLLIALSPVNADNVGMDVGKSLQFFKNLA